MHKRDLTGRTPNAGHIPATIALIVKNTKLVGTTIVALNDFIASFRNLQDRY